MKVHVVSIDDSNLTGVSLAIKEKCAVEAVAVSVGLDQLSQRGFPLDRKGKHAWKQFRFEIFPLLLILLNFMND